VTIKEMTFVLVHISVNNFEMFEASGNCFLMLN